MSGTPRPWNAGRIFLLVVLVGIVGFIGVAFAMHTVDQARQSREWKLYAGRWVRDGSNGDDYIQLNDDGTYRVHVSVYLGSIEGETWTSSEGRVFVPTQTKVTVGGPGSGDETVYGWYLDVRGDTLVHSDGGTAKGTYRRE